VALAKINLCAGRHNDRFSRLARVKERREAKRPCWHKGKTWSQGIKHRIGVVYVQLENKNLQFRISTILEIAISEVSAWSDSQPTMLYLCYNQKTTMKQCWPILHFTNGPSLTRTASAKMSVSISLLTYQSGFMTLSAGHSRQMLVGLCSSLCRRFTGTVLLNT